MISLICGIEKKNKTPHRKRYQTCGYQKWRVWGG